MSTPGQGKGAGGGKSRERGNMWGTGIAQHKGWDTKVQERSFVVGPQFLFSLSHTQLSLLCNHLQWNQGYSDPFYLRVFWFISYFCQITYLQKLETNSTGDAILHRPKSSLIWFTFFLHLLVKIFQQAFKVKLDFFVKPSSPTRPYSQVAGDWLIWVFDLPKWQEVRRYKSGSGEWDQLKSRSSNTINSTRFKRRKKALMTKTTATALPAAGIFAATQGRLNPKRVFQNFHYAISAEMK